MYLNILLYRIISVLFKYSDGDRVTLMDPENKVISSCEKLRDGEKIILKGAAAAKSMKTSASAGGGGLAVASNTLDSNSVHSRDHDDVISNKKKRKSNDEDPTEKGTCSATENANFGNTPKRKRGIPIPNSLGTQNPEILIEEALDSLGAASTESVSPSEKLDSQDKKRGSSIGGPGFRNLRSADLILRDGRRISDSSNLSKL